MSPVGLPTSPVNGARGSAPRDFQPTGQPPLPPGYAPTPAGLLVPGTTPPATHPQPQNATVVLPYASEGGQIQGTTGYTLPYARTLPVLIQKLAGATTIQQASHKIPFPFILRSLFISCPATILGNTSDALVTVAVGPDNAISAAGFGSGQVIMDPFSTTAGILCSQPVNIGGLWLPFTEGHEFILVLASSLGGATAFQLVVIVGITPLADIMGG